MGGSRAREPGERTKIAVHSLDPNVDPVGACVGMRGSRVQAIVREVSGEKIDIVHWSADLESFIRNAMSPAKLDKVIFNPEEKQVLVVLYHVLLYQEPYRELGEGYLDERKREETAKHLTQRLRKLGYAVSLSAAAA